MLILKKTTLNEQSNYGDTPLIIASTMGNLEMVKYLIEQNIEKIDLNQTDKLGKTAFAAACFAGKSDVVKYLLTVDGIDFEKPNKYGLTPLEQAISNRQIAIIDLLTK